MPINPEYLLMKSFFFFFFPLGFFNLVLTSLSFGPVVDFVLSALFRVCRLSEIM